jgi:hypothetical protein
MRPITGLILGAILIPFGLALALLWLPAAIADAGRYDSAPACTKPAANASGCWSEIPAVVTKTEVLSGRYTTRHYVDLRDDFGTQEVEVLPSATFDILHSSQEVSARFWKGDVALIRVPGEEDLITSSHPGENVGTAFAAAAGVLLAGLVLFLGALGVHRYEGSWTVHVPGGEYDKHQFDLVAPPARRWLEGGSIIVFAGLVGGLWSNEYLATPIIPGAFVGAGLAALAWSWWLHHRARKARSRGKPRPKPR